MSSVIDNMKGEQAREAARTIVRATGLAAKGGNAAIRAGVRLAVKTANALAERRREREAERENKATQVISPYGGFPATYAIEGPKGGTAKVVVAPVVLTPLRAQFADSIGNVSTFALAAAGVGLVAMLNDPAPYWWGVAALGPWPFRELIRYGFRKLFRKRTILEFTPEHFVVHRRRGRMEVYDRQEQHRFRLDNRHEDARREARELEIKQERARMRGQVIRPEKYYGDTFHLIFDYGNQPHFVMDIMGQEEALWVLGRLKKVTELMEKVVAMGAMVAEGPKSEWDDMAGQIPEKV